MTPFGILGGTFDPIHNGHLGVAAAARAALGLATVQLAPARVPPHRAGPLVSIYHRFAMVAIAAETDATLVACELGLDSTEPSYTGRCSTSSRGPAMRRRRWCSSSAPTRSQISRHGGTIRPSSTAATSPSSPVPASASRRCRRACRPWPAASPPAPIADWPPTPRVFLIDSPTPDVSSTEIRARARAGASLEGLVPPSVARYVRRHGLYADARPAGALHE